jgi:hypothetical protein
MKMDISDCQLVMLYRAVPTAGVENSNGHLKEPPQADIPNSRSYLGSLRSMKWHIWSLSKKVNKHEKLNKTSKMDNHLKLLHF